MRSPTKQTLWKLWPQFHNRWGHFQTVCFHYKNSTSISCSLQEEYTMHTCNKCFISLIDWIVTLNVSLAFAILIITERRRTPKQVKTPTPYNCFIKQQLTFSKQVPIYTPSRHRATLSSRWSCVSGHQMNASPIFTFLLALDWFLLDAPLSSLRNVSYLPVWCWGSSIQVTSLSSFTEKKGLLKAKFAGWTTMTMI